MSLQIVSARSENLGIALRCPHCSFVCRHDVSHVEDCIKFGESLVCVACGGEFWVVILSQTRVAELRDEAADVGQGMASRTEDSDEKKTMAKDEPK